MEKIYKTIKASYLLLILLFSVALSQSGKAQHHHPKENLAEIPITQLKNDCKFFLGDTLNGFPLEATIEEGIKKFDMYAELKWYVSTKENEFVKNKYHIKQFPWEIKDNDNKRLVIHPNILNASCNNIDFEAGTFAGWIGNIGFNANSNAALTVSTPGINTLGINSPETGCSFHTLMTAAGGVDPTGLFPVVDPGGGTYAVRLGGENINTNNYVPAGCILNHPSGNPAYYSNGETLEQTFSVTPNNTLLTYNYAVVLARAPHPNGQQPYFRVEVLDHTGAEIPCLNYYVQGDSAGNYPGGFVNVGGANGAEYLSWQQSSLNLLPYLGTNITVRFTAAGCIPGGHFGYGYVDCACAPLEIIIPKFACQGGTDSLIAPPVAGSTYSWAGPGIVGGTTSQVATANVSGSYSVTITNALGCSYTLDTTLIFYPNPTVNVTGNPPCAGGTTTLTATSTGSAGTLTYTWNPAAGLVFSSGDSVAIATPATNTNYSVTGTSVQGCTNTAVVNVIVNAAAPPTFTAPTVCIGSTTPFTNTTVGGSIFNWNFGDIANPQDTSTQQNPSYTYPSAGNYVVSLTVTTTAGCISHGTQTVSVISNPTASFNAPAVCLGAVMVFTSTITNGNTYNWTFGDGQTNTTTATPSNTYTSSGTFPVSLTVTATGGCSVTVTNSVVVNSVPTASFSAPPVCMGNATVFTSTITNGNAYNWAFGDGNTNTTTAAPSNTYTSSGTFPVSLTVTAVGGCSVTVTNNVVVNPIPTASFSAPPVCLGNATVFTSTITNGNTYSWTFGDGQTNTTTATPSNTYATANTFAVSLTVTTVGGCTVTATNSVVVNVQPTASFTVAPVCQGTPSFFDANTSTPAVGATYGWSFGGATPNTGTVTVQTDNHTYSAAGTFPVTLLVSVGTCTATATGNAVVNPFPTLGFTADHPCNGTAMNFINTTTNQAAISNWNWSFGDGSNNNTASPPAHTYSAAGCYSVALTATASTGCAGSFSTTVNVHANPVASFNALEPCLGLPSDFMDNSSIVNPACLTDNITSWNWAFGDGGTATYTVVTDTVKHTYATCGPKNITLTVTTNNNCTNVYTMTGDTVFCLPVVSAPPSFSVCPNTPVANQTFTSTVTNGGPAFSKWLAFSIHTGMPPTDSINGGLNVVPGYTSALKNLTCGNLIDTVKAKAISSAGCFGNTTFYTVTLFPTPYLQHMPTDSICANQPITIPSFTTCPLNSITTWTNSNTTIGLAANGTGNIGTFTALNTSNALNTAQINAVPTANGCVGNDSSFAIVIKPIPTMVASGSTVCPTDNVPAPTITTNPAAGVNYNWTATNNTGIGMPASGTGIPTAYTAPTNMTLTNQIGVVTYTPTLNGCAGPPATDTINIKPSPIVSPVPSPSYCPSQLTNSINFVCLPSGGAPIFTWGGLGGIGGSQTGNIAPFLTVNTTMLNSVGTFTVYATLNSCKGPNSTFTITVFPNPIAKFRYARACEGKPMSFFDESYVGNGFFINAWSWDMNHDGIYGDATAQSPQYTVSPAGWDSVGLIVHSSSVPSCSATVKEDVFVNPNPTVNFIGVSLTGCPNVNTAFTDLSLISSGTIESWNWNFGNGQTSNQHYPISQTYTNTSPITPAFYTVTLTVATDSGCSASASKPNYVEVYPKPIADFTWGPVGANVDNPAITFYNEAIGYSGYPASQPTVYGTHGIEYYLGDVFASNPNSNYQYGVGSFEHNYSYYNAYTYYATQWVINSYGCMDSITKPVEILPDFTFYIPNAFSPNKDGKNDGFKGIGEGIDNSTYNLWVFDRWGLMIYHAQDIDAAWDGHMHGDEGKPVLQEDVYVWKVKFKDIFGSLHEYHGTVTLLK